VILLTLMLVTLSECYKEDPKQYEEESVSHIDYEKDEMPIKIGSYSGSSSYDELNQTPAEDRNWQVKPKAKVKRMTGKKIHIYLKNDEKPKRKPTTGTTTLASTTTSEEVETSTRQAPEVTTRKSDKDTRFIKYSDKDSRAEGSSFKKSYSTSTQSSKDVEGDSSDHHEQHVIKEKIKIKHHHHHHHHNHVKTVVKKEPYPV
jgi:hypothetical protein